MNATRRHVLTAFGATALLGALPRALSTANAATFSDYKALVCVFLYGGNDGNNMIVPTDTAGYAAYSGVRGDNTTTAGALGIPLASLAPLAPATGSAQFGLHPDLKPLQALWDAGRMAAVFNVGTLVKPTSMADYQARRVLPANLFSHLDQQTEWQTAFAQGQSRTGWAGRIADAIGSPGGSSGLPVNLVVSGDGLFSLGTSTSSLAIPQNGGFGLNPIANLPANAVLGGFDQLLTVDRSNQIVGASQDTMSAAVNASRSLSAVLTRTSSVAPMFTQNTGISQQLRQVARVIEKRADFGVSRQIFFVSLGSFDTHSNQIARQSQLFQDLAAALGTFDNAMQSLGVVNQVTTFTLSDFARTLKVASGGGSDHAWGNHHLVMGGAVKGKTFYGTFPQLVLGGPDDVSTEGRWLPTLSVDQYAATLAQWFGVSDTQLSSVFPNLASFAATPFHTNVGFV